MRKYIMIQDYGDMDLSVFDDLDKANDAAELSWKCLSERDRKHQRIYVVSVENTTKYFNQWELDDPEEFSWGSFHSADQTEKMWDSDKIPIYRLPIMTTNSENSL